jgi:hypothetical protein
MRTLSSSLVRVLTVCCISITLFAGIFGMTHTAKADCTVDSGDQYCLLEPIPQGDGTVYDKYDPSTTDAAGFINMAIKVFISIIGALGVIMIVIGGVQYMTTDAISKKEGGKEMISHSIFGLLLALVSVVLLNTINPHLTDVRIDPPAGISIDIDASADDIPEVNLITTTVNGQEVAVQSQCNKTSVDIAASDGVKLSTGEAWGTNPKIKADDDLNREQLEASGVHINAANCAKVGDKGCTSVYKIGTSTIQKLVAIREAICKKNWSSIPSSEQLAEYKNCKIVLTGGTECWLHKSHHIGSGNVDLSATPNLTEYITGNKNFVFDGKVHEKNGISFLAELAGQFETTTAQHWHVKTN